MLVYMGDRPYGTIEFCEVVQERCIAIESCHYDLRWLLLLLLLVCFSR